MELVAASEVLARSSTLTSVGWIGYIIIGALAGWIAGKIVKGGGSGLLMNIVIGIVGALIGGFLLSFFVDTASGGWWFTLFTAILGAVILLWIVGLFQRRRVG
ncbi:membrane protein [Mycolicibacterium litorale]|uniref:Membrane protein n=1 Tax=Mycolicibacterium litorale TaxID=758802 RepID=A0A6S6P2F3_9MYCO|nr:GlsB/YeaQ/YmgE family stress response membrane protein [Mycolicibacterium litorale]BCI51761.1 membrane protein [Mycolicibacterium litorale]